VIVNNERGKEREPFASYYFPSSPYPQCLSFVVTMENGGDYVKVEGLAREFSEEL
jgi:hypothetical protein